jgi:hypothetical protein
MDTTSVPQHHRDDHDHQDECPHACYGGWVFVGYIDEYGEERQASYRCRRCKQES